MMRKHKRRVAKAAFAVSLGVAMVLGLYVGSASSATRMAPTVKIGFQELPRGVHPRRALRPGAPGQGLPRDLQAAIGSTEIIQVALTSGQINFYPEYTGVIVQDVFHNALSPKTAAATFALASKEEAAKGFTLLAQTPFFDTDAIAVTNATAKKYGLHTIVDLKKVPDLTLGAMPEFQTRNTGLIGLEHEYGLTNIHFNALGSISAYQALDSGKVLAADVFSTDPPLAAPSKYTVLTDPKNLFGFENVAPIVATSLVKAAGPSFVATVNAVSSKLTQRAIIAMNKAVEVDQQSPATVAAAFLKANGLG